MLLITTQLQAQQKSLTLRLGPGHLARQDQIFSPFVHTDWSMVNAGIRYEREANLHHWIDLGFGSYNPILTPSYTFGDDEQTWPHSFLLVKLTYALGKQLSSAHAAGRWTVGGFFENDIQPSTYNYGHVGSFGYFASVGLGAWARYTRVLNKRSSLSATAQVPVVALVAHSPYLVNDDEFIENTSSHNGLKTFLAFLGDGEIQTLNRIQQVELHFRYSYQLNNRWNVGAWYEFHFVQASKPIKLLQFRNVLNVTATLTF
jgi:hypothetical protein